MTAARHNRKSIAAPEQRPDALATADVQMQAAKAKFTTAALACIKGSLDAEQQVAAALQAVDLARAALARASDDAR